MKVKSLFTSGKMNKDLDERLVPKGQYRDALNVKVANSTGSDVGSIENALPNEKLTELIFYKAPYTSNEEAEATCVGAVTDDTNQLLYWFVASSSGSYICEYSKKYGTSEIILKDEREGTSNLLGFLSGNYVQSNLLYDNDNFKTFIYFTDGETAPKKIEVSSARELPDSEFLFDDVSVIMRPPVHPPVIGFGQEAEDDSKNNLKERFVHFAYRYRYDDDQYSAMSPFSNVAFHPKKFSYDYGEFNNSSMINKYDNVNVTFNTGNKNVKEIDVIFKDTSDSNLYLIESVNKSHKDLEDNETYSVSFSNNQIYRVLPEKELLRLYDNVPLKAKSQEIINNRLVYGNYTENYNLLDEDQNQINVDIDLEFNSSVVSDLEPQKTVRSNRDYELGIVYLDEHGRSSTVLSGGSNSIYVPSVGALDSNKLYAKIQNKAPLFAKHYRFFIKESETDYDVITSLFFYEDNNAEVYYIRLDGSDKNKVKEGDYVIIKSDTSGSRSSVSKLKVLEVAAKERNFLDLTNSESYLQEPGLYMKVSKDGALNLDDASLEKIELFSSSESKEDFQRNARTSHLLEGPFFYGTGSTSINLVSSTLSTAVASERVRYEIMIDEPDGSQEKYKWRSYTIGDGEWSDWNEDNSITAGNFNVGRLTLSWSATTGNEPGDRWTFNLKRGEYSKFNDNGYGKCALDLGDVPSTIGLGSDFNLKIYHKAKSSGVVNHETGTVIASGDYENFEEFYWEEGVYKTLNELHKSDGHEWLFEEVVHFRRGTATDKSDGNYTNNLSDNLIFETTSPYKHDDSFGTIFAANRYSDVRLEMRVRSTFANNVILETEPKKENTDVYYEIGKTYDITDDGFHVGDSLTGDQNQRHDQDAYIEVDFFNAWTWGNGFESMKIKDSFNAPKYINKTRPLASVENYMQNNRANSLTYSNVYDQTTRYNGLNEFNLSTANYKDLDDSDGSIQNIIERTGDLLTFQENKISKILYNKSVLFTGSGSGSVSQSTEVLGQQIPYLGEYGCTFSPQSVVKWGGRVYAADPRRGAILRLSQDGITEISSEGMRDWFKDNTQPRLNRQIIGGYDPFNGQYIVSIKEALEEWREDEFSCEGAQWIPDTFECLQVFEPTTTQAVTGTTTTTTTTTTLPTFTCSNAGFTMSGGIVGDSTSGQGSVSSGTITAISPTTYQSGSTTYTATITVPSGYVNSGSSISTCTASATGTTNPCSTTSASVSISNVQWDQAGQITGTATWSMSGGNSNGSSGYPDVVLTATTSGGSFSATQNFVTTTLTNNSGSGSGNFTLTDSTYTQNGSTTVIVNAKLCGVSQANSSQAVTLTYVPPTTQATTYTATLNVNTSGITGPSSGYTLDSQPKTVTQNNGTSFNLSWAAPTLNSNGCYEWVPGQQPASASFVGTFSGSDQSVTRTITGSVRDKVFTASLAVSDTISAPQGAKIVTSDIQDTGTNGDQYSLFYNVSPATGYSWVGTQPSNITQNGTFSCSNVSLQGSISGTIKQDFSCAIANVVVATGSVGSSVVATSSVGTVGSISPSTYQNGPTNYTVQVTPPSGTYSSNSSINCVASGTGTTTAATTTAAPITITNGASTDSMVCHVSRPVNVYTSSGSIATGGTVYSNSLLTSAYNGGGLWYSDGTNKFKISAAGVVSNLSACQFSGSTSYYISTGRISLSDFCGGSWSVTNAVTNDGATTGTALNQTTYDNGSPYPGLNKYYIVSKSPYVYGGSTVFDWWRINGNGEVVSNGSFTSCTSGGDGGGNEY